MVILHLPKLGKQLIAPCFNISRYDSLNCLLKIRKVELKRITWNFIIVFREPPSYFHYFSFETT